MLKHKISLISLSAFLSFGGAAGGCAIIYKLAGYDAAFSFFLFGASIVFALLALQLVLAIKSEKRTAYLVLFNITFILGLVWFLLCLVLPIFWMSTIGWFAKSFFCLASVGLCSVNLFRGVEIFKIRWAQVGAELLFRFYDRKCNLIDWEAIVAKLKMSVSIYIPGIPSNLNPFVTVAIIVSMLAGLSLRNAFPAFSFFAWGIPTLIVVSLVMQMIGSAIGQFLELTALEKKNGDVIRPLR